MIITFISDTHTLEDRLQMPKIEGDLLIHAGDIMNSGYISYEINKFCKWFESQSYDARIFIAGNHDVYFEDRPADAADIVNYFDIEYLQDSELLFVNSTAQESVKIYGSPWQPEFYNWGFNLPRNGKELEMVWNKIPEDVDILITHTPPQGHLDASGNPWNEPDLGCELLRKRVDEIKPKIHVFGHIHGSYGYKFHNGTHFINAAVLDEQYRVVNKPLTINWNPETNELNFI